MGKMADIGGNGTDNNGVKDGGTSKKKRAVKKLRRRLTTYKRMKITLIQRAEGLRAETGRVLRKKLSRRCSIALWAVILPLLFIG